MHLSSLFGGCQVNSILNSNQLSPQRELEKNAEILQGRVTRLQAKAQINVNLSRLDLESTEFVQRYSGSEVRDEMHDGKWIVTMTNSTNTGRHEAGLGLDLLRIQEAERTGIKLGEEVQ